MKNRYWNHKSFLKNIRKQWEVHKNRFFERKGLSIRVSHLSYKEQGIDREPCKHLGPVLFALETEKNIRTKLGDINREIEARNSERERRHKEMEHEHSEEQVYEMSM